MPILYPYVKYPIESARLPSHYRSTNQLYKQAILAQRFNNALHPILSKISWAIGTLASYNRDCRNPLVCSYM